MTRPCACGCGLMTAHTWAPGHDTQALYATITEHYGTVANFIAVHRQSANPEGSKA